MPLEYEVIRTNPTRGADTPFVRKVRAKAVRIGPILTPEQILARNIVEKERQKLQAAMRGPQTYRPPAPKEVTHIITPKLKDTERRWNEGY